MKIKIDRASVCMADDVKDHLETIEVKEDITFLDLFKYVIGLGFLTPIHGNDIICILSFEDQEMVVWKTKVNDFIVHFNGLVRSILKEDSIVYFYYFTPLNRAEYLFKKVRGNKELLLSQGFLSEYESYKVSSEDEENWLKTQD